MVNYSDSPNGRAWCYQFQFPGKKPGMAGTVYARLHAPHHELEAQCRKHWQEVFPDTLQCPIVKLVPGALVFMPEGQP